MLGFLPCSSASSFIPPFHPSPNLLTFRVFSINHYWQNHQPLRSWIGFDSWWQISEGYFQFRQEGLRDRRGDFLFLPVDTQARRRSEKPLFPTVPRERQLPCGQNCRDCRRRIHPRLRCQSSREWPPAVSVEYATARRCVRRNRPSYFDFTCIRRLLCM